MKKLPDEKFMNLIIYFYWYNIYPLVLDGAQILRLSFILLPTEIIKLLILNSLIQPYITYCFAP